MIVVLDRSSNAGSSNASGLVDKRRGKRIRTKIALAILLPLVALVYIYDTELIPSESMLPKLKPGDQILTMRAWIAYPRGAMPARGDIILFHTSSTEAGKAADKDGQKSHRKLGVFRNEGDILIKRVVGLPGETIEFHGDDVLVNGRKLERDYEINHWQSDEADGGFYMNGDPVKLGPDEIYVMGDNRDNSDDSRYWGPLKREHITGKYIRVMFHREFKEKTARGGAAGQ
jgi:signal peptidase I